MNTIIRLSIGILIALLLAIVAQFIAHLPFRPFTITHGVHPIEAMSIALVLGIVFAPLVNKIKTASPGIKFSAHNILQLGIVLLGFNLNIALLRTIPITAIWILIVVSAIAFAAAYLLANFITVSSANRYLIAIGNAICGSSAIVALAKPVHATQNEVAQSVAVINCIGLVMMFVTPAVAYALGFSALQAGVWAGTTLQAVPQAVAGGALFSLQGGVYATAIKLTRVLLLGPYIVLTKCLANRQQAPTHQTNKSQLFTYIPPFIILFVLVVILNSLVHTQVIHLPFLELKVFPALARTSHFLLAMALGAIGLGTQLRNLLQDGSSLLWLALISALIAWGVSLLGCLLLV